MRRVVKIYLSSGTVLRSRADEVSDEDGFQLQQVAKDLLQGSQGGYFSIDTDTGWVVCQKRHVAAFALDDEPEPGTVRFIG